MTKEQLAEKYATNRVPNACAHTDALATGADLYEIAEEGFIAGYEAALVKWISVETPPEKEGAYLTFPHFTVLVYDNNDGEWDDNYWNNWDSYMDMVVKDNNVKFWMPLPKQP